MSPAVEGPVKSSFWAIVVPSVVREVTSSRAIRRMVVKLDLIIPRDVYLPFREIEAILYELIVLHGTVVVVPDKDGEVPRRISALITAIG
jgi:hypothetical protein